MLVFVFTFNFIGENMKKLTSKKSSISSSISLLIDNTPLLDFKVLFFELVTEEQKKSELKRWLPDGNIQVDNLDGRKKILQHYFRETMEYLNNFMLSEEYSDEQKKELGEWIRYEMYPYIHIGGWSNRAYQKPYGPGDHYTISQVYDMASNEKRFSAHLINYCFMQEPAAKAIRNRRGMFTDIILKTISSNNGGQSSITSIGCGPAMEVFDAYTHLEDKAQLKFCCVDLDYRAIENIEERKKAFGLSHNITAFRENIFSFNNQLPEEQDLIYAIGLMDYFSDRHVTRVLNKIFGLLKDGGRCIIGNYHTLNPTKALMDYVLDWPVYHRDEETMKAIFRKSKFGNRELSIFFENEQMNLFADIRK